MAVTSNNTWRGKRRGWQEMVSFSASGPISFIPRVPLGQEEFEKVCFAQPSVQRLPEWVQGS